VRDKIYNTEKKDITVEKKDTIIDVPPAEVDITWLPKDEPKYKPGQSVKINPGCRIRIREV
jgi:hypothetical protein